MSESEEERRARRERKKEAARRAAEKAEAQQAATNAAATSPATETEEERRIRKEKKRAERDAAKRLEEGGGAAAPAVKEVTTDNGSSGDPNVKASRRARKEAPPASDGDAPSLQRHAHRRHSYHGEEDAVAGDAATTAAPAPAKRRKSAEANHALLSAIEAENNAVVVAQTSTRASRAAADAAANGEPVKETEEERAVRKQAEREERRKQRHAAKAAAAAAATGVAGADAASAAGNGAATPLPAAGPSPTTNGASFDASALQRQAYRMQFKKDLRRATALRRLVDFDSSSGVVVDLAPQTAYDLYIRDFGRSGRAQAAVQAPPEEERLDAATQAERGRLRTRGSQAPEDLGLCPEEEAERQFFRLRRIALQQRGGGAAGTGDDAEENGEGDEGTAAAKREIRSVDAAHLERFLTSTLPLMSAVLDENNATATGAAAASAGGGDGGGRSRGSTPFSLSYTTFCWRGTRNRPLVQVILNPSNTRQLIALHGPREESGLSPSLDTYQSVLLLWNVHDTSNPERVLVSFSNVTSVCVSPSRPYLLYGGTEDGNVCVWSLREPDRLHLSAGRYEKHVFHLPAYNTSWQADGHSAPVRQVRVTGYNATTPPRKEEHEQLVSMDETGEACFWVVSEKDSSGRGVGMVENDCGQHPFTAVSLHLAKGTSASAIGMADSVDTADAYGAGVAASFDFAPLDSAQYVLTAPHGVVRRSRFGGIAVPSLYGPSQATYCYQAADKDRMETAASSAAATPAAPPAAVVVPCCVQFSALDPRWFVVGYEDGTLRLFLHHIATPQCTVEVGYQPIVAVRCSGTTPWAVWALEEGGDVHLIDFAHHNRQTPRLSHTLTTPDTGVCTCVDLSTKDERADQRVLVAGFEKGMVQLHTLDTEKLRAANAERDEKWI